MPIESHDDLVRRLQAAHADSTQRIFGSNIFEDAATRIESDAKRIAELEARLDAADAITRAIKLDRLQMAGTITMDEIRLRTGEGRLSYGTILWAVNKILSERATPTVNEKGE